MVNAGLFVLLGIAAFAFTANLLICSEPLANQAGTWIDDLLQLIGFSACDGVPDWVSFTLGLLIVIPIMITLGTVFAPIIGGLMANPVVGTIAAGLIAVSILTGIIGIITALVT